MTSKGSLISRVFSEDEFRNFLNSEILILSETNIARIKARDYSLGFQSRATSLESSLIFLWGR